jgi:hypothetical protein
MGTKQHGPSQQGSQPGDNRPQADRDLQRNKQGDRGQHAQSRQHEQVGGQQAQSGKDRQQQASEVPQSQVGGYRDFEHRQDNEGRAQTRQRQDVSRQQSASGGPSGSQPSQQNVYGEGNYAASRQYNEATKEYAESGRAEADARAAAPRSEAEAREMADAEAEGKRHAKGEDPALRRRAAGSSDHREQQDEE